MEQSSLFKRHFFLIAAMVVLVVMVVAGGVKLLSGKSSGADAAGQRASTPGTSAARPSGGAGARRGGFGGPTQITVAVVQPRTFEDTIEVLGVAKGRQSVTLTAATTQLVDRVRFVDGQRVARGAILVELRDTEQDAGIAQAEARLAQAQRAYDRYRSLGEKGFASKAAIDQCEALWRSAQADVAAAKARQNDRMIRAPFSGVVGLSDVAPGALVNPGAPIVTLDDVSAIRVDFQTPERYLSQIRQGQTLLATADAYPGTTITGRIAQVDTRVDERTRAITARAEFPNADGRLKPGMLMRVGISRGQRTSPSAPESAVAVQGDAAYVYVVRQMGPRTMVEQRPILTGSRQKGFVEIREGLKAGDRIVADGLNKIQPGQPVKVTGSAVSGQRPPGSRPQAGTPVGGIRPALVRPAG